MRRRSRRALLPTSDIAAARAALADAYLRTGDYDAVDAILDGVPDEADSRIEADVLAVRGMTLHFRAIEVPVEERAAIDPRPEEELFERALAIRRDAEDEEGVAESLWQLGLVQQVLRRDHEAGAPLFLESLELSERLPDCDVWLQSEIHRHVGFVHLLREEHDEAIRHLRTSLELREALPERGWIAGGLTALSMAFRLAGSRPEAVVHARRAIDLARAEGLRERQITAAETELRASEEMSG